MFEFPSVPATDSRGKLDAKVDGEPVSPIYGVCFHICGCIELKNPRFEQKPHSQIFTEFLMTASQMSHFGMEMRRAWVGVHFE